MIPEAAVEAAKSAYLNEFNYDENAEYIARLILEAAAPQLMAGAWDAAIAEADARHMIGGSDAEELKDANPYRTTK